MVQCSFEQNFYMIMQNVGLISYVTQNHANSPPPLYRPI